MRRWVNRRASPFKSRDDAYNGDGQHHTLGPRHRCRTPPRAGPCRPPGPWSRSESLDDSRDCGGSDWPVATACSPGPALITGARLCPRLCPPAVILSDSVHLGGLAGDEKRPVFGTSSHSVVRGADGVAATVNRKVVGWPVDCVVENFQVKSDEWHSTPDSARAPGKSAALPPPPPPPPPSAALCRRPPETASVRLLGALLSRTLDPLTACA